MTDWTPPGPGPWQQDSAHMPRAQTTMMRELYPEGFNRGFTETFGRYGLLLDRLAMGQVNGFTYHQPQPFDLPGPDGPMTPEQIHAEVGRREQLAAETFATKRWRADLALWDDECKPRSVARHVELGDVDVDGIDDDALRRHLDDVARHLTEMVYQHHRFNMGALLPVGDVALHVAGWAGVPPHTVLGILDGYSPISNLASSEMDEALVAIAGDPQSIELLEGDGDPAERLAALRVRQPAVDEYVRLVQDRPVDGFDIDNPTLREHPELVLGKIMAARSVTGPGARERADRLAGDLRSRVPAEHQDEFDELVAEARHVYRLRDERGLYSDMTAIGLLRRAALAAGRRLVERGRLTSPEQALEATTDELKALLDGGGPGADELQDRSDTRARLTAEGAPRFLGPPPPAPPPLDQLPPSLGRIMGATGFMIDSVLGQLDGAAGEPGSVIGIGVGEQVVEGPVRLIRSTDDLLLLEPGDIVVAPSTGEAFNSVLHLVGGIVTDHGSHACHAAIVAREMGFPAVVGTVDGSRRLHDGDRVRIDGSKGEVVVLS